MWGQWLRQWRCTKAPRALHATLIICKQIAAEKIAAWPAELQADRSARHAMRDARTELALDQMLAQNRCDEPASRSAGELAESLVDDPDAFHG